MAGGSQTRLSSGARRPLKSRHTRWANSAAGWLTRLGVLPNQISIASVVFSALAAACLLFTQRAGPGMRVGLLIIAAVCIQLRLLCNLLDGMVAIEGGRQTKSGEIFNDMPDRFADVFILVAAGYSLAYSWGQELGWIAALLSVLTAYVRVLGGATRATQYFIGPMAKQQRMAVLTGACLFSTVETWLGLQGHIMAIALMVISLGCVITVIRRTRRIVDELDSR